MRTEAASGLLFYMARINHADFATVQLRHGLPYFSYDLGSGDTNTMIPTKINDGQWHKVKGPNGGGDGGGGVLEGDPVAAAPLSPGLLLCSQCTCCARTVILTLQPAGCANKANKASAACKRPPLGSVIRPGRTPFLPCSCGPPTTGYKPGPGACVHREYLVRNVGQGSEFILTLYVFNVEE